MRVRCVRIINEVTSEETQSSPWLTLGKDYIVLSVYIEPNREVVFRLISDNSPSPVLFTSRQFEVMYAHLPTTWIAWSDQTGIFELSPEKWLRLGFWEDYFNNIPEAVRDFEEEQATIIAENNDYRITS